MHGDDYEPSRPIELFGHHGGADNEDEDDAGLPLAFDDATDSSSGAFMLRGGAVRYHHGAAQEGHSGVGFQPGQPGDYCWAYSSSGSGSSSSSSSSVLSFEQAAGCRPPAYNAGEDDTALWMDAAAMDPPGDYSHRQFGFVPGRSNSSDVGLGRDSFQQPKVPPQKRASPGGEMQPAEKKPCGGATRRSSKAKAKAAAAAAAPTKDTQTVAAKVRRERISERLKVLQDLVPNGTKVDLVTMLEKAINYVKFLQLQVKVLATDEFWPAQGGKAPELSQVKEALDAILSSQRDINSKQ